MGDSRSARDPCTDAGPCRSLALETLAKGVLAALFIVGAAAIAVLAVSFWVTTRPFIGGVDFYYYVLTARDLANGAAVPAGRYFYLPGVFSFWRTVFMVSDGSLSALQWAYLAVLFANAFLIGGILTTLTRSWPAGGTGAALYLFVAGRIEGFAGITEPIATVPFLLGLWLWVLMRGDQASHAGLLALAAGFGLAFYAKQQGGLLALGVVGLLPALWSSDPSERYRISHLAILPFGAIGVFLVAMALEGGGLAAVWTALLAVRDYQAQGSWVEHVNRVFELTQPVSNFFLSSCIAWAVLTFFHNRVPIVSNSLLLTLGIAIFATLGCLIQFTKRGYLHYAMLLLPSALIAAGLGLYAVIKLLGWSARVWRRPAVPLVMLGTAVFLWTNSAGATALVRDTSAMATASTRWLTHEDIGRTFTPLCSRVGPGTDLLLIPPRENQIHWFCRTQPVDTKIKNSWESPDPRNYRPVLASPAVRNVFVLSPNYGAFEKWYFETGDWRHFPQELGELGFHETFRFDVGTLYQKSQPGAR